MDTVMQILDSLVGAQVIVSVGKRKVAGSLTSLVGTASEPQSLEVTGKDGNVTKIEWADVDRIKQKGLE